MFGNNNNGGFYMPIQPAGYGNGMNGLGGDWLVLAFLLFPMMMMFGGWGGMGGMGGNNLLYPFMNQADITTNGFQNQANTIALSDYDRTKAIGHSWHDLHDPDDRRDGDLRYQIHEGRTGMESGGRAYRDRSAGR